MQFSGAAELFLRRSVLILRPILFFDFDFNVGEMAFVPFEYISIATTLVFFLSSHLFPMRSLKRPVPSSHIVVRWGNALGSEPRISGPRDAPTRSEPTHINIVLVRLARLLLATPPPLPAPFHFH